MRMPLSSRIIYAFTAMFFDANFRGAAEESHLVSEGGVFGPHPLNRVDSIRPVTAMAV